MNNFGNFSLYFAHALCLWGIVVSYLASRKKDLRALKSAERSLISIFILNFISVVALIWAFVRDDFTIKYVFEYSRRAQPLIYKITALWGGMEGSLLFWEFLLSFYGVIAVYFFRKKIYHLLPFTSLVIFFVQGFFLFLLSFKTNPFAPLVDSDENAVNTDISQLIDGNGLNPLLQNFYMAVHPPLLYLGFVGFTIPFALIISAFFEREKDRAYLTPLRYFSLSSWLFLGMGIIFGSYWAYLELGWGGYWGWDPVENASLIPFLTATAFLHTLILEKKKGIFKRFNYILITATFILSIYGTYLTRSGVLQSVHSFGSEGSNIPFYFHIGNIFLAFMASVIILSLIVAATRKNMFKSKGVIESAFSKETMILYGTILLSVFAFIVFYGVTSPIFYKIFSGKELYNGEEFYNLRTVPVSIAILFVMSLAASLPWGKEKIKDLRKGLYISSISGGLFSVSGFFYLFSNSVWCEKLLNERLIFIYFILIFFFCGFLLSSIFISYLKGVRLFKNKGFFLSLFMPFRKEPSRYGGLIVHSGVIIFCAGVAFSSVFQEKYDEILKEGESFRAGGVVFHLSKLSSDDLSEDISKVNELKIWAEVDIFENEKYKGTLIPMRVHYRSTIENNEPPSYEVAIKSTIFKDLYMILGGFDLIEKRATLTLYINPFVAFLWLGGLIILIGGIFVFIPPKREIQ